jgi:hypothetical protein
MRIILILLALLAVWLGQSWFAKDIAIGLLAAWIAQLVYQNKRSGA